MIEQKGDSVDDRPGIDHVVIVEDEGHMVGKFGCFIKQDGQGRFDVGSFRRLQCGRQSSTNLGVNRLQGGDEVGQEADQVVIAFVQREPGDRLSRLLGPVAHQGCFAEAGRGRDKDELVALGNAQVEPFGEARPGDQVRPRRRDIEFRLQQRFWHTNIISENDGLWCSRQGLGCRLFLPVPQNKEQVPQFLFGQDALEAIHRRSAPAG
jgi:hypothetical protein